MSANPSTAPADRLESMTITPLFVDLTMLDQYQVW
jgi:hypothetical protein